MVNKYEYKCFHKSQLDHGCIVWNATIQYSARSGPLSVNKLFTSLHSTMPSVMCLRLRDVSVICRVTYFQFPNLVYFSSMSVRQTAQRRIGLRNIGHRTLPKIWIGIFQVRVIQPRGMIFN